MAVLIHLGHPGFLPKMLIYCISRNLADPVFLVDVTFASSETKSFLNTWNEHNGSFGHLITYADSRFWVNLEPELLEHEIIGYFDDMLTSVNVDILRVEQVLSFFDGLNAFGVYCCAKNRKFGILSFDGIPFDTSHEDSLYTISKVMYKPEAASYLTLLKKYRTLSVYCQNIEKIICIGKHPVDNRCEDFDYSGTITSMNDTDFKKVSDLFHCNLDGLTFDYFIPLRSYSSVKYSGINFSKQQSDPQKLLTVYRRLLDHILEPQDTVLLKAHPNFGIPDDALKTFPNALYYPGYYPSEFLNRNLKNANCICIGGSTASIIGEPYLLLPESFFSVGNIINSIMVSLKIMSFLGAYPLKLIDGRLERYRAVINLTLKKESCYLNAMIIDGQHTPVDVINDFLSDGSADLTFIINPTEHTTVCKTYHVIEYPGDEYNEEVIGDLSDFYIDVYDNTGTNLSFPPNLNIPMERCGTTLRVKLDSFENSDITFSEIPSVQLDLGRAYRDGTYIHQDLLKACYFINSAYCGGISWACPELFDILLKVDTKDSIEMAVSLAIETAESGNGQMQLRLARLYAKGKGVQCDLYLAAKWMRMGVEQGLGWAKNELFDILWRINTPESAKEMISVASDFAKQGDGGAMGRLGRAYRDGKGVERNLSMAADWMRKAKDKNVPWAEWELMGILWKTATVEAYEEMGKIINFKISSLNSN